MKRRIGGECRNWGDSTGVNDEDPELFKVGLELATKSRRLFRMVTKTRKQKNVCTKYCVTRSAMSSKWVGRSMIDLQVFRSGGYVRRGLRGVHESLKFRWKQCFLGKM